MRPSALCNTVGLGSGRDFIDQKSVTYKAEYTMHLMRLKAGATMTILVMVSMIASLLVQIFIASYFGSGWEMDAYLVAGIIPFLVMGVINEPLGLALVPMMNHLGATRGREDLQQFTAVFLCSVVLLAISLGIVMTLFTGEWLIRVLAPGFTEPQVSLSYEMFLMLIVAGCMSILSAVLGYLYNFNERFVFPYSLGLLPPIFIIGIVFLFSDALGIASVALGILLGTALQCIFLVKIVKEYKIRVTKLSFLRDILATYKNAGLITLSMLPLIIIPILDRYLAGRFPQGSIAYIGYSWGLAVAASTLVSRGALTTIFPYLSTRASRDVGGLRSLYGKLIVAFLFVTTSGVAIAIFFRYPLIQMLFVRGEFTSKDATNVSDLLLWHLVSTVGIVLINLVNRISHASRTSKSSAAIALMHVLLYILLAFTLMEYFSLIGLAIANALSYVFISAALVYLLIRKEGRGRLLVLLFWLLIIGLAGLSLIIFLNMAMEFFNTHHFLSAVISVASLLAYLYLCLRIIQYLEIRRLWVANNDVGA